LIKRGAYGGAPMGVIKNQRLQYYRIHEHKLGRLVPIACRVLFDDVVFFVLQRGIDAKDGHETSQTEFDSNCPSRVSPVRSASSQRIRSKDTDWYHLMQH